MSDASLRPAGEPRRGFFATAFAYLVGLFCLAVPTAAGVVTFLNPLRKKRQGGAPAGEFTRVANLDDLPEDGTPVRVPVLADRRDAWNYFPEQPVGAVWLRRTEEGQVLAFQGECPHLGCDITFVKAEGGQPGVFRCPCHENPTFDLQGTLLQVDSSSPRDLDALDVKIENNDVLVKFQEFTPGISEQIVKS